MTVRHSSMLFSSQSASLFCPSVRKTDKTFEIMIFAIFQLPALKMVRMWAAAMVL